MRSRILFLLIFFTQFSYATLIIDNNKEVFSDFTISYLHDTTGKLNIEEIVSKPFSRELSNQFSLGYRSGSSWFKIDIDNRSIRRKFVLFFAESMWSEFHLYRSENGIWREKQNGLKYDIHNYDIKSVMPTFYLDIPLGQCKSFYIKGRSISSHLGEFKLFSETEYSRHNRMTLEYFYYFYLSALIIILILNILLFTVMRQRIYAYYILYITAFIGGVVMMSGIYRYFGFSGWPEGIHALGSATIIFQLMFSSKFLELSTRFPHLEKLFKVFILLLFICFIAIVVNVPYISVVYMSLVAVAMLVLVYSVIKVWGDGHPMAFYYLLVLSVYNVLTLMFVLSFIGIVDNSDTSHYAFLAGSFFEVAALSLLLANGFRLELEEKIVLQKDLLHEKHENQKLLESSVVKRTLELEKSNELLQIKTEELEGIKEQLSVQANTDALTLVYNRYHFSDISQKVFHITKRNKSRLSLMMIDLDWFKIINDTHGHLEGDKVLLATASALQSAIRVSDVLARFGGEEFIVLLPDTSAEDALTLAQKMNTLMQTLMVKTEGNQDITWSVSIGVAEYKHSDVMIEDLIKRADHALYAAKDKGRNCVEYEA